MLLRYTCRATIMQHQGSSLSHASTGSVAMPGVIRNSAHGPASYHMGNMSQQQFGSVQNQSNLQHLPPSSSRVRMHLLI